MERCRIILFTDTDGRNIRMIHYAAEVFIIYNNRDEDPLSRLECPRA